MKRFAIAAALLLTACGDNIVDLLPDGSACTSDTEACESGYCLEALEDGTEITGGTCTHECEWLPDQTDTCPDGQTCVRYNYTGEFFCLPDCVDQGDCRTDDGWVCTCLEHTCAQPICVPPL